MRASIRLIVKDEDGRDGGLVHTVAQHVVDRAVRLVDGELGEVRAAETGQLRMIGVGETQALRCNEKPASLVLVGAG
jgi:hypothetical protein